MKDLIAELFRRAADRLNPNAACDQQRSVAAAWLRGVREAMSAEDSRRERNERQVTTSPFFTNPTFTCFHCRKAVGGTHVCVDGTPVTFTYVGTAS